MSLFKKLAKNTGLGQYVNAVTGGMLDDKPKGDNGGAATDAELARLIAERKKASDEFIAGGAAQYKTGSALEYEDLDPETLAMLGESGLSNIEIDPQFRDAELDALRQLENQANEGLTDRDRADMAKLQGDVNRTNRGRIGAIQQNMSARGLGGSGLELVAQMQAAQDAADREAMAALEQGAISSDRRNQATIQRGALAGQMGNTDYTRAANAANANDAIKRFNVTNANQALLNNNNGRNSVAQQNWQRANQTSDNQAGADYRFRQDSANSRTGAIDTSYNHTVEGQNRRDTQAQQEEQRRRGMLGGIGAVAGAAFGSQAGPQGAMAGAQVGNQFGQAMNFARGGIVPGPITNPFDDESNDTVPAKLSPGEIVLPKSVAMDPKILDYLSKSNPELVNQYRAKLGRAEQGATDARSTRDMGSMANVAGGILSDFNNSQKKDVVLRNRMDSLGKAPSISKADRPEYDGSAIDKMGAQGVSEADKKLQDIMAQMKQDYSVSRDMNKDALDAENVRKSDERYKAEWDAKREDRTADQEYRKQQLKGQQADRDESRKLRATLADQANGAKINAAEAKQNEKMEQLRVGDLGFAQTADDAKKLKDATVGKAAFDAKLKDLISLREKHGGGALLNREDVNRAQQLSKSLLLDYKNLQSLGVLSASDESIINAVIPSDPLEWRSPVEALSGQDSVLHKLKSFQGDSERDYQTNLKTRLRHDKARVPASKDYDSMSDEELEALLKGG